MRYNYFLKNLYEPVVAPSGFTEHHADRRLRRVAVRDLSKADGPDGGGAAVSRRCRRPHRLLPPQAFSRSPGTGSITTHRANLMLRLTTRIRVSVSISRAFLSGSARRYLKLQASPMRLLGTCEQCGPSPWRTENWSRSMVVLYIHRVTIERIRTRTLTNQNQELYSPVELGLQKWRAEHLVHRVTCFLSNPTHRVSRVRYRTYSTEVEKSAMMNEALGRGIAVFQGLSNIVLNCEC